MEMLNWTYAGDKKHGVSTQDAKQCENSAKRSTLEVNVLLCSKNAIPAESEF